MIDLQNKGLLVSEDQRIIPINSPAPRGVVDGVSKNTSLEKWSYSGSISLDGMGAELTFKPHDIKSHITASFWADSVFASINERVNFMIFGHAEPDSFRQKRPLRALTAPHSASIELGGKSIKKYIEI
jgi:hypothetical protein